jgi:hypothetical protein
MNDARHILLSSKGHAWQTPTWFLDLVRAVGQITLDPATSIANPTNAATYYAPWSEMVCDDVRWRGSCGLSGSWERDGLAYINPPYGGHLPGEVNPHYKLSRTDRKTGVREIIGTGRGWAARIAQDDGESLVLVPARTETVWWRRLFGWCDDCLLWSSREYGSRIHFIGAETGELVGGSTFPSSVFYRGPRRSRFGHVYGAHGELLPGRRGLSRSGRRPRAVRVDEEQLRMEVPRCS